MARVLVAYTKKSGSTSEVGRAVAEELEAAGGEVDLRRLGDVTDLGGYDAVVVGGPMILGWRRDAVRFLADNQASLSQKPVALFMTAKALTRIPGETLGDTALFHDPGLGQPPKNPAKLSFKEKEATPQRYLEPVLKKAPAVKPFAAGFFAGKITYSSLNVLERFFVKRVVGAQEGDSRNWNAIRDWARTVAPRLVDPRQ